MTKPADGRQLASELSSLVQQSNTRARFMRQAGSRITLQASFSLTSRGHELSSRSPPDARSLKSDARTGGEGGTFASRLLAKARAEIDDPGVELETMRTAVHEAKRARADIDARALANLNFQPPTSRYVSSTRAQKAGRAHSKPRDLRVARQYLRRLLHSHGRQQLRGLADIAVAVEGEPLNGRAIGQVLAKDATQYTFSISRPAADEAAAQGSKAAAGAASNKNKKQRNRRAKNKQESVAPAP